MLKESFDWVPNEIKSLIADGKGKLLKLVAKTETTTVHPEDKEYTNRKFSAEELKMAARTLWRKPVGINHEQVIENAWVVDSEYEDGKVEAIAYVPNEWAQKVESGLIDKCSVEYTWNSEKREGNTVEFGGLKFGRVDLLEGKMPGDADTSVKLFEAVEKKGVFITELTLVEAEEPEEDDDNPEDAPEDAPDEDAPEDAPENDTPDDEPEEDTPIAVLEGRIKELEDALARVIEELSINKTTVDERVEQARKEAKLAVGDEIRAKLPLDLVRPDMRTRRLLADIKGIIGK